MRSARRLPLPLPARRCAAQLPIPSCGGISSGDAVSKTRAARRSATFRNAHAAPGRRAEGASAKRACADCGRLPFLPLLSASCTGAQNKDGLELACCTSRASRRRWPPALKGRSKCGEVGRHPPCIRTDGCTDGAINGILAAGIFSYTQVCISRCTAEEGLGNEMTTMTTLTGPSL